MTHVVLTGFMAVGKTAVGKRLARRLGRPFVDTDSLIEKREGMAIKEIFKRHGEAEFRRIEEEVVADYRNLGLSLRSHPLALLRKQLREAGWISCDELKKLPNGAPAAVTPGEVSQ